MSPQFPQLSDGASPQRAPSMNSVAVVLGVMALLITLGLMIYAWSGSTPEHSQLTERELHSGDLEHPGTLPQTHRFTCSSGGQALVGFGDDGLQVRIAIGSAPPVTLRAAAQGRPYLARDARGILEGTTLTLYRTGKPPITCERLTKG